MFKLTEYAIPDYYNFYSGNYISLNSAERIVTTTPSQLFSYQVADGYIAARDKTFNLTMVFLTDESFANAMDTLMWLAGTGKEGKLKGVIEGTPNRNFYMWCTCTGIEGIEYDKSGTKKLTATFYARELFWIEEETVILAHNTAIYTNVRVPTRFNIHGKNLNKQYLHFRYKCVEHGDWVYCDYDLKNYDTSAIASSMYSDSHFLTFCEGATFDLDNASFSGYVGGDWFATLMPANKASYAGSYQIQFANNTETYSFNGGTLSNTASMDVTLLKLRGIPF